MVGDFAGKDSCLYLEHEMLSVFTFDIFYKYFIINSPLVQGM